MTEKEKMLNGELYMPDNDETLFNERIKCKTLCYKYNNLSPDKLEERKELIKQIIGKVSDKFHIEQPFYCDYGYNIELGENFYCNHNIVILDCAKVTFGDNVFIGSGARVIGGVIVGNNVTIAPNAVVSHDVEDNVVVGGIPAKIIRRK